MTKIHKADYIHTYIWKWANERRASSCTNNTKTSTPDESKLCDIFVFISVSFRCCFVKKKTETSKKAIKSKTHLKLDAYWWVHYESELLHVNIYN